MHRKRKKIVLFSSKGRRDKHHTLASLWLTGGALAAAGLCLGWLSLYFSTGKYGWEMILHYLKQPALVLLNAVPFILISLLVWFCTNRAWIGFLCSGVLCLLYSFVQHWRLMVREDPLFASDVALWREGLSAMGEYACFSLRNWIAIGLVVGASVLFFFCFRGKVVIPLRRIISSVAVLGVAVLLYATVYTSPKIYNSFEVMPGINRWFENNDYMSRGGVYPFIYSIKSAKQTAPAAYNKTQTKQMLEAYQSDDIPKDKQVSVVFVMYEAYADLSAYLEGVAIADAYDAFHQLQQKSYCGKLVTNIFAGGTVNTERSVLTGFASLTDLRRKSWSFARYFSEQGYLSEGSHAGYGAFYNRQNINENLGLSPYRFIENHFISLAEGPPTDAIFLPEVARLNLAQMQAGQKVFSFNVTYQNHGPYPDDKLYGPMFVPKGKLDDKDYHIINNYLSGINETGYQMQQMVDLYAQSDEPVVLVFFGDHKPWLGEQNSTYKALGVDLNVKKEQGFYNYYSTEYMMWANDAAKKVLGNDFVGAGPTISPCFLMNELFAQCGWGGPSYMKLTNEVMATMPVVSDKNKFLVEGRLVAENRLSEFQKEVLTKMRHAQFYLAQHAAGVLP